MTKEDIIKDCEKIIYEIKLQNEDLKIKFISMDDNGFVESKKLIIQDQTNKIIVMKDYIGGPKDFKLKYKNNKFI